MPAFPKFSYVQIEQAAPCCYLGGDSVRGSFAVSREFRCDVLLSGLMSAQSCRSALACGRFIHFRRKAMDRCCLLWHMTQPGLWLLKGESRTVCDVDELLPPRFATRAASTVWYSRASGGQLPPFRFKQSTGSDRRGLAGGHRSPKLGRPVPGRHCKKWSSPVRVGAYAAILLLDAASRRLMQLEACPKVQANFV